MNLQKTPWLAIAGLSLAILGALAFRGHLANQALGAAVPSNGDFPGIYNSGTVPLVLQDGFGGALAVDSAGRVILSPSSTANFASLTWTNATGTNTTSTNLYWTNASGTSVSSTNLFTTNGRITNLTVTNCTGCGGGGGTSVQLSGTFTTGDIAIAMNTSTISRLAGLNVVTSTLAVYLPTSYTLYATSTVFGNGTSTAWNATNYTGTSGTVTTWTAANATSTGWLGYVTASGTNFFAAYSTATNMLTWLVATGTTSNLFNVNVSGTIDTASGTGMTCGGQNCRQTLLIAAQSGTPTAARGAATATTVYMPTNGQVVWLAAFQPGVQNQMEWSTPMPNNWDGGTLNCHPNWVSTSTPTFNSYKLSLRAVAVGASSTADVAFGASSTWGVINDTAANIFQSASDTSVTVGGSPSGAKEVWFEFARLASDAATTTFGLKSVECTYGVSKYNAF